MHKLRKIAPSRCAKSNLLLICSHRYLKRRFLSKLGAKRSILKPKKRQEHPKRSQQSAKGCQMEPTRSQMEAKGSQNGANTKPKSDQEASQNRCPKKVAKKVPKSISVPLLLGSKTYSRTLPFWRPFSDIDFGRHFGRSLAPFWRPLGSIWGPWGILLAPLGTFWPPLGTF